MWRPKDWLLRVWYSVSMEIYDKKEVELGRKFFDAGGEAMYNSILREFSLKECVWITDRLTGRTVQKKVKT